MSSPYSPHSTIRVKAASDGDFLFHPNYSGFYINISVYTSHGTTVVLGDHTVSSARTEVTAAGGPWSGVAMPTNTPITEQANRDGV